MDVETWNLAVDTAVATMEENLIDRLKMTERFWEIRPCIEGAAQWARDEVRQ